MGAFDYNNAIKMAALVTADILRDFYSTQIIKIHTFKSENYPIAFQIEFDSKKPDAKESVHRFLNELREIPVETKGYMNIDISRNLIAFSDLQTIADLYSTFLSNYSTNLSDDCKYVGHKTQDRDVVKDDVVFLKRSFFESQGACLYYIDHAKHDLQACFTFSISQLQKAINVVEGCSDEPCANLPKLYWH